MRKLWNRIPVRLRAALAALAFAAALLVLWGAAADWAVPSPQMALRLAEREHAYGPGEIAAQGELSFQADEYAVEEGRKWFVSRSGDRFAAVVLERKLGFLWQCADFLPMRPSEERPINFTLLGYTILTRVEHGNSIQAGIEDIFMVCSSDPEIASVEVTVYDRPPEGTGDPAAWREENSVTVCCTPVGEQIWVGQAVVSGISDTRLRGYGADGALIYDSGMD